MQRAGGIAGSDKQFMRTQSDLVSGAETRDISGKIEFDQVSFTYPDTGIQTPERRFLSLLSRVNRWPLLEAQDQVRARFRI